MGTTWREIVQPPSAPLHRATQLLLHRFNVVCAEESRCTFRAQHDSLCLLGAKTEDKLNRHVRSLQEWG